MLMNKLNMVAAREPKYSSLACGHCEQPGGNHWTKLTRTAAALAGLHNIKTRKTYKTKKHFEDFVVAATRKRDSKRAKNSRYNSGNEPASFGPE